MRIRKSKVFAALFVSAAMLFTFYVVFETWHGDEAELTKDELTALNSKLDRLAKELDENAKTIDEIRRHLQQQQANASSAKNLPRRERTVAKTFAAVAKGDALFASQPPSRCDIRMNEIYDDLTFDNPDGGVWKQGWPLDYKTTTNRPQNDYKNQDKKLKVVVVPHSHNDPGWVQTFEDYFRTQTKHILDNVVAKLGEDRRRKFVWAEISFFALWWVQQTLEVRAKTKKLLKGGQLEIVTGGWVMNDEANSFYYAIVEQLVLGHEWCRKHLDGYKPNNGWSIDPFGMSPTMAYLLKRMGLDNMLVQRTHYSVKKRLARSQDLEFVWRQSWDHGKTTDMLTHMMPFYSYDVPHTCGPDPKICCQFDFARLPGNAKGFDCPWKVPPQEITEANVAKRAEVLLDQYRKKAMLFKTSTLLVPLGDDFRYMSADECDKQFDNYQKIFDHVNSRPELNAEMSFGTLSDYFDRVRSEAMNQTGSPVGLFNSLSGDFFTYADRDDHYWSGYYTSRPFYKNLDRVLEGYLRAAEVLFSMTWAEMEYVGTDVPDLVKAMILELVMARHNLALFQHHDGITGTAKDHVVIDYGTRMVESIAMCQKVMSKSAHYLLTPSKALYKNLNVNWYDLDDLRESHNALPRRTIIEIQDPLSPSKLVLFNSQAKLRTETVTVLVTDANIRVYKVTQAESDEADEEETVEVQISPVFDPEGQISNTEYELSFVAEVKALALETYYVAALETGESNDDMDVATIRIHNSNSANTLFRAKPFQQPEIHEDGGQAFSLQNGYVEAEFTANGFLTAITTTDDKVRTVVKLEMIQYRTRSGMGSDNKSGAYLFLPHGAAEVLTIPKDPPPLVRIVEGKIMSYVEVLLPWMRHVVMLKSSPGPDGTGVHINNDVDIRKMGNNIEIGMRLSTDVESGQEFFTDLNGFQMIRRLRRLDKLPIQANYYPIPSMLYIHDSSSRLTLITKQPLGGSSLSEGQVEILMDRRLMQDDNRGLGQGITDNHLTPHSFFLLLERKVKRCQTDEPPSPSAASYPTLLSLSVRHGIINPIYRLIHSGSSTGIGQQSNTFQPVQQDLSCDVELVNLRTMLKGGGAVEASDEVALILHRQGFNACYRPVGLTCGTNGGKVSVATLFPEMFGEQMKQMSLSLMHDGIAIQKGFTVSINPMELYTFLLRR